jgi:hypothetical protein
MMCGQRISSDAEYDGEMSNLVFIGSIGPLHPLLVYTIGVPCCH